MKKLKIMYHDGSIQVCSPVQEGPNKFDNNWRLLAEQVAGRHSHRRHAYKKFEII